MANNWGGARKNSGNKGKKKGQKVTAYLNIEHSEWYNRIIKHTTPTQLFRKLIDNFRRK